MMLSSPNPTLLTLDRCPCRPPLGAGHLGMFRAAYTPIKRGFDEHMGYYQGCGSAYTHVASCCHAGSADGTSGRDTM